MNHSYKVARPAQLSCFLFTMACGTVDIVVWLHWLIVQLDLGPHIVYCVQICFWNGWCQARADGIRGLKGPEWMVSNAQGIFRRTAVMIA